MSFFPSLSRPLYWPWLPYSANTNLNTNNKSTDSTDSTEKLQVKVGEISSKLSDMAAHHDKKRYELEMQHYAPVQVPIKDDKGRGKKRPNPTKDPNEPKKPTPPFFWFCNDERPKVKAMHPELSFGEIAKELGRRWATGNPEVKRKYETMAERDKARYEWEMTAYKKQRKV